MFEIISYAEFRNKTYISRECIYLIISCVFFCRFTNRKSVAKYVERRQGLLDDPVIKAVADWREVPVTIDRWGAILNELHGGANHQEWADMADRFSRKYYFDGGIKEMCKFKYFQCLVCDRVGGRKKVTKPIVPILERIPMHRMVIDFNTIGEDAGDGDILGVDPVTGARYLLVVVDHATGYQWTQAFKTKHMAEIAQFLFELFLQEGNPKMCVV